MYIQLKKKSKVQNCDFMLSFVLRREYRSVFGFACICLEKPWKAWDTKNSDPMGIRQGGPEMRSKDGREFYYMTF